MGKKRKGIQREKYLKDLKKIKGDTENEDETPEIDPRSGPSAAVYKNAKASIELKEVPHFRKNNTVPKIKIADLQHLVLWVLANGENPNWIFVKNKPLIPKVVVVFASGIGHDVYTTNKQFMPHITALANFSMLTSAPGDKKALFPPLNVFYGCLKPKSQRNQAINGNKQDSKDPKYASATETVNATSLEDLILTSEELADNNFPLPDRLVAPELVNPHTSEAHLQKFQIASSPTTTIPATISTTATSSSSDPSPSSTPSSSTSSPSTSSTSTSTSTASSSTSTSTSTPTSTSTSTSSTTSTSTSIPDTSSSAPTEPTPSSDLQVPKSRSVCVPAHGQWTRAPPKGPVEKPRLLALDCEMCLTVEGLELTRVSLINECKETVYDSFVLPYNNILNYNTQYSGITEETLHNVTVRLEDVQKDLCDIIDDQTILAGHSLGNDLIALKFVHTRVIDTSVMFPSTRGSRTMKNALRWLVRRYLQRTIQTDTHNSIEDSIAVMDLVKFRLQNPNFETQAESENLFDVLHAQSRRAILIDIPYVIREHATLVADVVPVTSDANCVQHTVQAIKRNDAHAPKFIVAQLHDFRNFLHASSPDSPNIPDQEKLKTLLHQTDENLYFIYQSLPENTLMVVATLQGDANYFIKLQRKANEDPLSVTQAELEKANDAARSGVSFFLVK